MPKNERKINRGSVRVGARVFKTGEEDELNDVLSPADAKRLSEPGGPLSGKWTGKADLAPEPVTADNAEPARTQASTAPAAPAPRGRPRGSTRTAAPAPAETTTAGAAGTGGETGLEPEAVRREPGDDPGQVAEEGQRDSGLLTGSND